MTFSDDSSDNENLNYLIATNILPGITPTMTNEASRILSHHPANIMSESKEDLQRLSADYFSTTPKYRPRRFKGHFRLPVGNFNSIEDSIKESDIFVQREEGLSPEGICPRLCPTAALCMPAYEVPADSLDE